MPEQDKTDNSDKELNNTTLDSASLPKDSNNTADKEKQHDSGKNEDGRKDYKPDPVIVYVPKQEDTAALEETRRHNTNTLTEQREGNKLTRIGIAVNTILVLCTLGALWFTRLSVGEAKRANDHTIYKDSISHIEDSLQSIIQRKNDSLTHIKDSITITMAQRSLQTQINSFNDAKLRYETENRPFVQTFQERLDTFEVNKPIYVSYQIRNFGKFPATIIDYSGGLTLGTTANEDKIENFPAKRIPTKKDRTAIAGENVITVVVSTSQILTQAAKNAVIQGKAFIYLVGNIHYETFGTNKSYTNSYMYKISLDPRLSVDAIKNTDEVRLKQFTPYGVEQFCELYFAC